MRNRHTGLLVAAALAWPALLTNQALAGEAAPPSWTGFYIGVHYGYGWDDARDTTFAQLPNIPSWGGDVFPSPPSFKVDAAFGGGQIGYNFQFAQRGVIGIETDFSGSTAGPVAL
jgi:outer membrane immunogenic protein